MKCMDSNTLKLVRKRDRLEHGAILEGSVTDTGDTVRQGDDRQSRIGEYPIFDPRETVGQGNRTQVGATKECITSDARKTVGQGNRAQGCTILECSTSKIAEVLEL